MPLRRQRSPGPIRRHLGLVAAYAFDEGAGGVVNDASGNGHFGTISGATWTSGRYGGALSFNGSDASVLLGGLGTFYNAGFTLEAWVQKADAPETMSPSSAPGRAVARCSGSTTSPPATT